MLENFHNTLLAYCSKRTAFRLAYKHKCIMCSLVYKHSDSAYRTWIQLADLDQSQSYQYHRRYQKQTHNWDVVKVMQAKDYIYIPKLLKEIFLHWDSSSSNMKSRTTWIFSKLLHMSSLLRQLQLSKRDLDFNNNNNVDCLQTLINSWVVNVGCRIVVLNLPHHTRSNNLSDAPSQVTVLVHHILAVSCLSVACWVKFWVICKEVTLIDNADR